MFPYNIQLCISLSKVFVRVSLISPYVYLLSLQYMFSTVINRSFIMTTMHRISIVVYSNPQVEILGA